MFLELESGSVIELEPMCSQKEALKILALSIFGQIQIQRCELFLAQAGEAKKEANLFAIGVCHPS